MYSTFLSNSASHNFSSQIKINEIDEQGQEKLKQSEVAIYGLEGIGIAVMRCLLAAGIGRLHIIDDGFITEEWLPQQTLFGLNDVGKMRCIAAHSKTSEGFNKNTIVLHCAKLHTSNAESIIGKSRIIVETFHQSLVDSELMDYADNNGIVIHSAFCRFEKSVFGMYSGNRKSDFREIVTKINKRIPLNLYGAPFCFSSVSSFIGGILACNTIKSLLDLNNSSSELFEFESTNYRIKKLL